jgi:maltooligosyltrehalose trehalohydrolase
MLTGERTGYYADFGALEDVGTALREGFVCGARYSVYRRRRSLREASAGPGGTDKESAQRCD